MTEQYKKLLKKFSQSFLLRQKHGIYNLGTELSQSGIRAGSSGAALFLWLSVHIVLQIVRTKVTGTKLSYFPKSIAEESQTN